MTNKTVAVTGCTGGLGKQLCFALAKNGFNLIMVDRNQEKSERLANVLRENFQSVKITNVIADMENFSSVKTATERLISLKPNVFIANAGAYSIKRCKTDCGFENVFQINFVSPYFMISRLTEALDSVKIVAVGSIAHRYSKIDLNDIDFSSRKSQALIYGNSKRFLMLALSKKFKDGKNFSLTHPGITFTNITAHYPKLVFAIIKYPMKIIFPSPKKAVLSILNGVFGNTEFGSWIGPAFFDIWGKPKKKKLKACFSSDSETAYETAQKIYNEIK